MSQENKTTAIRFHILKAIMHQIRFRRLRLCPRHHRGSWQHSPRHPTYILGVLLLRKEKGGERET